MKHLYTTILALLCVTSVQAQMSDDEYDKVRQDLNRMFIRIHKGTVPTGYLLDYGVDLLDLSDYDGTELTDSNLHGD